MQSYLHRGSAAPENIKYVSMSFYDDSHVNEAKRLLWQTTNDGVLKKYEKRNDTSNRSSKDADMSDIMKAFSDIDKKRYDEVIYVCADASQMPNQNPEDLHDMAVQNRLQKLEQRLKVAEEGIFFNDVKITDAHDTIKDIYNSVATHEKLIGENATEIRKKSECCSHVRSVDEKKELEVNGAKKESDEMKNKHSIPTDRVVIVTIGRNRR